jgi:hypothetical protein
VTATGSLEPVAFHPISITSTFSLQAARKKSANSELDVKKRGA